MFNEKDLIKILCMTSDELLDYINDLPHSGYQKIVDLPYYICFVPDNCLVAPLICAHVDTVGEEPPKEDEIIFQNGKLFLDLEKIHSEKFVRKVLGGDDRCGVIVALEVLKNKLPYIISFMNFEEVGGKGSSAFSKNQQSIIVKSSMFIGLDGLKDREFAFYEYRSDKCAKILNNYLQLKEFESIAYTDCSILAVYNKKPAVNLAVGVYNIHSEKEFIILSATQNAYKDLEKIYNNFYNDFWVVLDDVESVENFKKRVKNVINKVNFQIYNIDDF